MKIHTLQREQALKQPLEAVFAFFNRPENLEAITPPSLRFRILSTRPVPMRAGTRIDYRLRLFGVPVRWTSAITVYEPPHRFVDVQLKGPYAFWEHEHLFRSEGGRTHVRDTVRYALPGGPFGRLLHGLYVRRHLEHIFRFRARTIARLLGE